MQQFLEVFSELKGKNLYVSGESVRPQEMLRILLQLTYVLSMLACMFPVSHTGVEWRFV